MYLRIKTGETLCVVKFDDIGATQGWSDKTRLQLAYDNLIARMKHAKAKDDNRITCVFCLIVIYVRAKVGFEYYAGAFLWH